VLPRPTPWLGAAAGAGAGAGAAPPVEPAALFGLLDEDPQVRVVRRIDPAQSKGLGGMAAPRPLCPPVAVVEMSDEQARALAANPQLWVEPDQPLVYTPTSPITSALPVADPALAAMLDEPVPLTVRVRGTDGAPVAGAHVWAVGTTAPAHAVTDPSGRAALRLEGDTPETVRALCVRPAADYWSAVVRQPRLAEEAKGSRDEAVVELRPLAETFAGFPDRPIVGWGQQAMRLHEVPQDLRGHGVRIALLDSGVSSAHPDLKDSVHGGYDFVAGSDRIPDVDPTGRATWCAGVIAAADNRAGIAGVAAEAELYSCGLFPHGRISHLVEALDWCVTQGVDIAQIDLSYGYPSEVVALKLADVRRAGVACIAPAGDAGAGAALPAALPSVLSVGAVGAPGAYPPGTLHEYESHESALAAGGPGMYAPAFTAFGPGVDLAAPGEGILTTAVTGSYTVAEGTALAAAHVTGLAALMLAHHAGLRGESQGRSERRVDQLLGQLAASCVPVAGDSLGRSGAGVPDARAALGLDG
jgi:hypothetical protein